MQARRFRDALHFATAGVVYAITSQRNMKIHLLAGAVALLGGWWLGLDRVEFMILLVVIALVLVAEMFNTAVEAAVNIFAPGYNPWAKIAKDVAAGAVLLSALLAVIVGAILVAGKIAWR